MAKTDYAKIAASALKQLEKAGMPVSLNAPAQGGGYVPGVGVVPASPAQSHEGVGALFGYKANYIDGTAIQHGDQRCLLAAQIAAEPKVGYTLTAGDKTYNVVSVERVAPAGIVVLYKLQLRGV